MASNPAASIVSHPITGPFSLEIPPTTYCPGSDVEGEVLLQIPKLQKEKIDEVVVELRGKLQAKVLVSYTSGGPVYHTEKRDLVSLRTSLWNSGSACPPQDSHVLRLPFRFHLPSGPKLLPSIPSDAGGESVSIKYYVEVIGRRPRVLFGLEEKTMRRLLTVVSRGDPSLCESIRVLRGLSVEGGPTWKRVHKEKKMRRGIWGEYSNARVELLIPNQHRIVPNCIEIPLLITIKTTTARLPRAKAHKHSEGKPVFPAIDFDSNNRILVNLQQAFTVHVRGRTAHHTNQIVLAYLKPEDILPSAHYKHWQADTSVGDKEEMGRWVQQLTIQRTVELQRFPPTFESDVVDCAYVMSVQVPFPGLGNDVHVSTPITLDSGIEQAMPKKNGRAAYRRPQSETTSTSASEREPTTSVLGADVPAPRVEHPSNLSRPPSYFEAVYDDSDIIGEGD